MFGHVSSARRVAILGSSGGIGSAFVDCLAEDAPDRVIFAASRNPQPDPRPNVTQVRVDYAEHATLDALAEIAAADGPLDLVIVATGLLHDGAFQPEKDWRQLDAAGLARSFEANTIGPALAAKALLPVMPKDGWSVFAALSARVGSISDNRLGGWYGYRASKAALNMIIRCLAIELQRKRRQTICVGLHPGTVDTGLSKPFQSATKPGQVVEAEVSARNLLGVIGGLEADANGSVFAWDGTRVPE